MGSPLAPVLANFFMGHYEKLWLNNYTGPKVLYYRRYVDDIICCFRNSYDARLFFEYSTRVIPTLSSLCEGLVLKSGNGEWGNGEWGNGEWGNGEWGTGNGESLKGGISKMGNL